MRLPHVFSVPVLVVVSVGLLGASDITCTGPGPADSSLVAPGAVIDIREGEWVQARRDQEGEYLGVSVLSSYVPLPVFFEGWRSSPRSELVEYIWDFGDGTPEFRGFNAAHVYEVPGTWTATLTVVNSLGQKSATSVDIEALAPDGTTYYVNSALGNDANSGTSPGAGAWRTATHVFQGMESRRYGPGDEILFTSGQTFEVSRAGLGIPGPWQVGWGYTVGAYGVGPKPIIQAIGAAPAEGTTTMFPHILGGNAFISYVDLEFRMESAEGARFTLYQTGESSQNILFLRCDVKQCDLGLLFQQTSTGGDTRGMFFVESSIFDSAATQIYTKASGVAILDSEFDLSDNHLAYLSRIDKGIIARNTFRRAAFGRHALRLNAGAGYEGRTNNVVIKQNTFEGWIDPKTTAADGPTHSEFGSRYNWLLVHLAPNGPLDPYQLMEDVVFEQNTLTDAETLLNVGSYRNLVVRDNVMSTQDDTAISHIIFGSKHGGDFDRRPLKNIEFTNNTVTIAGTGNPDVPGAVFEIRSYTGPEVDGSSLHEDIRFENNSIHLEGGVSRVFWFRDNDSAQIDQISSDRNVIYNVSEEGLFQAGGGLASPETLFDLDGWRMFTGLEIESRVVITRRPDTFFDAPW